MAAYFDSSVVLSMLLKDSLSEKAALFWEDHLIRTSSILLAAESVTILRRTFKHSALRLGTDWLKTREDKLGEMLEEVTLQNLDEEVLQVLIGERRLSDCRSLDALHLATAIFLRTKSDEPLVLCTFDDNMAALAEKIGFEVCR